MKKNESPSKLHKQGEYWNLRPTPEAANRPPDNARQTAQAAALRAGTGTKLDSARQFFGVDTGKE